MNRHLILHLDAPSIAGGSECKCHRSVCDFGGGGGVGSGEYFVGGVEGSRTAGPDSAGGYGHRSDQVDRRIIGTDRLVGSGTYRGGWAEGDFDLVGYGEAVAVAGGSQREGQRSVGHFLRSGDVLCVQVSGAGDEGTVPATPNSTTRHIDETVQVNGGVVGASGDVISRIDDWRGCIGDDHFVFDRKAVAHGSERKCHASSAEVGETGFVSRPQISIVHKNPRTVRTPKSLGGTATHGTFEYGGLVGANRHVGADIHYDLGREFGEVSESAPRSGATVDQPEGEHFFVIDQKVREAHRYHAGGK